MTDRLVVDLGAGGEVKVATVLDMEVPSFADAAPMTWPLDGDALEDLRWYLEDYLIAPYGVYEDRGARIAGNLGDWGTTVFGAVFGAGPARDAYLRMRTRGEVEIVFRSDVPGLLGLPWELMADPGRGTPLALDVAAVSRALPAAPDAPETVPVPEGKLRVLMVISRPSATGDVGYQMIARPLLTRLEAVRGQVDLVVLRPPTLDALRAELTRAADAGTPYQIVHFDGHGAFHGLRSSDLGEGVLAFEHPQSGGPHAVAARVIARLLADARVPVVVLNACQSGAVGKNLEAALATSLLREGVASVVAMAYSIYAVAAAEFMAAFYERLFAGDSVSSAVTAGRRQLFRVPDRPSPKGDLPLADWIVPVHYARREVTFPQARVERPAGLASLADALAELSTEAGQSGVGDLDAVDGVFVGRDALFYDLEVAARLHKVVVLVGPGGTGKTELAKAFGRWWRNTGGVEQPDLVFWHSFEPGVANFGLDEVISEIGLAVLGPQFARLESPERLAAVRQLLREHRTLLIWDNFESVRSMPDPGQAVPSLDEEGCTGIRGFVADLAADGKSAVLITSRTTEDWLGDELRRVEVSGLTCAEAVQYADALLAPYPDAQRRRAVPAFADLMTWLDGHPLSMRLILRRLADTEPEELLASLQGTQPLAGDDAEHDRTKSLAASLAYSYAHLSGQTRRLLPALSLFRGMVSALALGLFSGEASVPKRFAGATAEHWTAALEDAARVGLLVSLGAGMYRIHPALPGYLAVGWRGADPVAYEGDRDAATGALLTVYARLGVSAVIQIRSGDAARAYMLIGLERHTMGSLLAYSLRHQRWEDALDLAEPLYQYWLARGLVAEARAWSDRVLTAIAEAGEPAPRLDTAAGFLWLVFSSAQADDDLNRGHLDEAERQFLTLLDALAPVDTLPDVYLTLLDALAPVDTSPDVYLTLLDALAPVDTSPDVRRHLGIIHLKGIIHHKLGLVAWLRGRLDEAEDWYRQALAIEEEVGIYHAKAQTYHQMGMVAQQRGQLAEAEDWYRQALAIEEEVGNRTEAAGTYHQLGVISQLGNCLAEAESWYRRALLISTELGDRTKMAHAYHSLGTVAEQRDALGVAESWYRQALAIREETGDRINLAKTYHQLSVVARTRGQLGEAEDWCRRALAVRQKVSDRSGIALSYHQLGMVAQQRGLLEEAEEWYRRALAIAEETDNRLNMALTYGVLGTLAYQRGQTRQALTWAVHCVALFEEFPHPLTRLAPQQIVILTSSLGMTVLEDTWRQVTGAELPRAVRDYVTRQVAKAVWNYAKGQLRERAETWGMTRWWSRQRERPPDG